MRSKITELRRIVRILPLIKRLVTLFPRVVFSDLSISNIPYVD